MNSGQIRKTFTDFFISKGHHIVPSAPMVIKNDPSLMFTNAGMNQFKDVFLGNLPAAHLRIANSQKCLRVSGKHNDLEEVGHDTYHHTMFEMLGNWSFGDYFKEEAIAWAWELLTGVYGIGKDRLYVTVFGGDEADGLRPDMEARDFWKAYVPEDRILYGSKKDNFWEMGDTGPCGPCSEVHVDIRSDADREKTPGKDLVNADHPQVIEIWNLVFIEFNRISGGALKPLPAKHVDTGMGFERLCMVLQGKQSNYDTDVFQPFIQEISRLSGIAYGKSRDADVAMRVVADHLRAVAFAIADGELPSNNKAGYVIRRILRRAIRYGYTFLGFREPFVSRLVPVLAMQMGEAFPELLAQQGLIEKVIAEEEASFLRTLSTGIQKFDQYVASLAGGRVAGDFAFELFDTYGFPIDLTRLMAREKGLEVDLVGFEANMQEQKQRSRAASVVETEDWTERIPFREETRFLGYEQLQAEAEVVKYRKISSKGKVYYQVVLNQTPFYAESGGQVGDRGVLVNGEQHIPVVDTRKENNLTVHITEMLPASWSSRVIAIVDAEKRALTENNHTATHLMHAALRKVLGDHVQQKGSLVNEDRLRFDFAHFSKMSQEEIRSVEQMVNEHIRQNINMQEHRDLEMEQALEMGAMALFGEKYGDKVRVIAFDPDFSAELCGGTHVHHTGRIGLFKIVSEGAIAAGIRRIEAITGKAAEAWVDAKMDELEGIRQLLKNPRDTIKSIEQLLQQQDMLRRQLDELSRQQSASMADTLLGNMQMIGDIPCIATLIEADAKTAKDLAYKLKEKQSRIMIFLGHQDEGRAGIAVMVSEDLTAEKGLNAGQMIKQLSGYIQGGGGGQAFFATAGGKHPDGLPEALEACLELVKAAAQ